VKTPFVLIVDDEPDILVMVRTSLEADGFRTALAGDGETALARVREHGPDVVVLDLMMPMLDGWAVIEALSEQPRRPALVVVSAKSRPTDVARAYRLGADAYLTKPFDFDELTATIHEVAERSEDERREHREEALRRFGEPEPAPGI
jgi:DNA-binding response OmpR family regulator